MTQPPKIQEPATLNSSLNTMDHADAPQTIRVWDPLVRVFHWVTVCGFFGAYIFTSPRVVHEALGWTIACALLIRIIWGFVGKRHARFSNFVPWPQKFFSYCLDVVRGRESRYLGHNPAGGAMVVILMAMIAAISITGWMMGLDAFWGEDWVEELHESLVNFTLFLVVLHVGGVVLASIRHSENLVASMVTGVKRKDEDSDECK